jgi:hypothetical protein
MKFVFRWAFRLAIVLVVLVVAGILLLDSIVKGALQSRLRRETGMEVRIGSLSVGLLSPEITVENLKVYNTAEFGGSPFVELPEVHVEYDRGALFSHRLHCKLVRFHMAELNLVQNKAGKTNWRALAEGREWTGHDKGSGGSGKQPGPGFDFAGIETLNLTLGKATLLRMSNPSMPWELHLNVRNKIITGIKTPRDLQEIFCRTLLEAGGKPVIDFASERGPAW